MGLIDYGRVLETSEDGWTAAVQDFHQRYEVWPWEVLGDDGWTVAQTPDGPAVGFTRAGIIAFRRRTDDPANIAYLDQALAEMDAINQQRLNALHQQLHDQIHRDNGR
ncbi:hypothetical protein CFP71_01355 [Amycolatopsis thailandensis]|uniref:Uncharacterized protein n=1 Tax=Amycolatopsis thailandensis TaxID=589330 RepID=A0A229SIV0_9PSEU|nr:hypothetical protein [Amycolatopsis thailandensis]OXM58689.1 hypothetical protein CFP71_01355 [Amycolatopsis thailandensis]